MTTPIIFPPGKGLFSISGFPVTSGDVGRGPIGLGVLENICPAVRILKLRQSIAEIIITVANYFQFMAAILLFHSHSTTTPEIISRNMPRCKVPFEL